jgi:hypothetical protein
MLMMLSSMVVRDLDLVGIAVAPHEADPVLQVDADAVLALSRWYVKRNNLRHVWVPDLPKVL